MPAPTRRRARAGTTAPPLMPGQRRVLLNPPPTPKQAVVVVHGIGEQRPLETLREFVEAVYQRDLDLTFPAPPGLPSDRDVDEYGREINRISIVPDDATGSKELRRITTASETINHKVTDFYELYWADLVQGTTWETVAAWFRGLLFRSPYRVPARPQIWIAWMALWLLAAAFVIGGYWLANPDSEPIKGWATRLGAWLEAAGPNVGGGLLVAGVLLLSGRWALAVERTKFGLPSLLIAAGATILALFDTDLFANARFWSGLLMAVATAITIGLVVPYVGDIVRFVRATPSTMQTRADIRGRGLTLLKELHTKGLDKDGKGSREYDRIVVVGHSLGCLVAYDLLQRYWEEIGPNHRNAGSPDVILRAALEWVDTFVKEAALGRPLDLAKYAHAQQNFHHVLAASGNSSWLVSDFVTLGSPIVHAEFLVSDSHAELDRLLKERMFSASPPRPELPNATMLYWDGAAGPYAHHAAMFAATRWTNLYDDCWFPAFGDIISGKVPDAFGPGVEEHPLRIERPGLLRRRLFTHTWYWRNADPTWAKLSPHIEALRRALRLA